MKRTPIGMLALLLILALLAGCSSKSTDQVTEEFAWNAAATDMEAPGETYAAALPPLAEIYPWNPTLQTAAQPSPRRMSTAN